MDTLISGDKLRNLIESRGWNMSTFAREAGIAYANLHRLCSGKSGSLKLETLVEFARVLKMSPGALLDAILATDDQSETNALSTLIQAWDALDATGRARLAERAAALAEDVTGSPKK